MGITKILSTTSCKRVIEYLEKTKYEDAVRNVGFCSIGINSMDPYSSFSRMLSSKGKLNENRRRKGKEEVAEAKHIITSFAIDELRPDRQGDVEKAQEIMRELMLNDYNEYGAASVGYLQTDNGFIHFHRLYPTVTVNGKGLKGDIYNFYHCAHKLDNAMEKYGVNQSLPTMKERVEGYDKGEKLKGPKKNNRNEIKAYIAGVIDEGLKDVNINSEEKYVEYLESKDISLNKRKRVGDSRKAGYDIYDWTYEYHYVDKGPKLKDKSMKVRAKQITDENGENIYTPDPVSEKLKDNLIQFNKIAEENRRRREEEARREDEEIRRKIEDKNKKFEERYKKLFEDQKAKMKAESARFAKQWDIEGELARIRAENKAKLEEKSKIEPTEPVAVEDSKDKDGNGVDDYHEALVNKRVSEIEELSNLDEDQVVTEEDLIEEAIKEKPKTTHVKADLNRKSPKRKSPPTRSELNDFMRRGAELNAQSEEKDDGYEY
ncbi:hypothetical protein ACF3NF_07860 (plasmid) [Anaerococcus martiniensis]|uniref:hypothetical protein n=1 Tax=Anaerococcus sp. WGS1579 TaxID=3366809 RepID=UPI00372D5505